MRKIASLIRYYQTYVVLFLLTCISYFSFLYFFQDGSNLLYGDALSRLNISRKIFDNLTPGLAQFGNVWLPLPQLLMLPFIWNEYLWHSGIAGAIVSMTAFIVGGIYLYQTVRIVTKSSAASFFALIIYGLNINLLYYQTTAMSEPIFISVLIAAIYYFVSWMNTGKVYSLMAAGVMVSAATLIRYEALAILLSSIPMVFVYSIMKSRDYKKAEGNTILYATLACLGFILWTLYLTAIFGDPLYWKNFYASARVGIDSSQARTFTFNLNFFQAAWKYFTAVIWMNGLIPTMMAIIAIPFLVVRSYKHKSYFFLPLLLSSSIFLFMILTLQRNTPIDQPVLSISNLLSPKTSKFLEFNIRYGLLMLPIIALMCGYLFSLRSVVLKTILIALLLIQFYSYFSPQYSVIYQIPISVVGNTTQGTPKDKALLAWLKNNYDSGLIMISALKHDPQMLELGVNYKTYIHEGTGKYWKESRKNPQRYAKWVVFDYFNKEDQVTKYLKNSPALNKHYNLLYNKDGMRVYKIKTKPDIEIKVN